MPKKYRFVMNGNNATYTLQGSRREVIRDAMGSAISTRHVPPIQLLFRNGHAETDDEKAVQLIQEHKDWGRLVTWHPTCIPTDATKEVKEQAKEIAKGGKARVKARAEAMERAREGSIPKEE
jgi:hypothetical protein